jgi:hypothetical protein
MNLLYYLAEANVYLGVFYLAYCLLLTKETHYQLNRAYLLFSCMAAFVLPVLQIGVLKPVEAVVNTTVNYAIPEYTEPLPVANNINTEPVVIEHHLSLQDYLVYVYLLGACIVFVLLIVKLFNLFKLMRNAQTVDHLKYKVVYLPESGVAFSFFNYLFIGTNAPGANTIVRHELVHIRQKHSFDIVFLELLKVVSWFNPFVYLLQNSLKTVHEYIADEQTAAHETDALTYSTFLVNNAYGTGGSSITHSFFNYNLLKKRIIMLHQQRSGSLARLKYLVTVPICAGLLCTSTLAFSKTYGWVDLDPATSIMQDDFKLPNLAYEDKNGGVVLKITKVNDVIGFNDPATSQGLPLLIANGKHYKLDQLKKDFSVIISADSTTQYNADNTYAINTWGKDAANGVLVLHGKTAAVKIEKGNLPETAHINFPRTQDSKGKLPPPSVFKPGFGRLMGHIQHNVNYTDALRDEKNSFVGVSFNVGADRKISDIKIFKPAGNGYDAIAKAAFESFDGVVTAKPGIHTFMLNYFSEKGPGDEKVLDGNKYDVNLVIVRPKPGEVKVTFPPPIVRPAKDLTIPKDLLKYLGDNINYPKGSLDNNIQLRARIAFSVANNKITGIKIVKGAIIGGNKLKIGDNATNVTNPFQIEIVKALQRYSPAGMTAGSYSLPVFFAIVKENSGPLLSQNDQNDLIIKGYKKEGTSSSIVKTDTVAKPDWEKIGRYFSRNVKYPSADRQQGTAGRVITLFAVDDNHNLQYAKVVRTPSELMGAEVLRSLKACTELGMLKPGVQYIIPISYTLNDDNGNNIGSQPTTGASPKASNPDALIYNPNNIDITVSPLGSLQLNEVVIRGYTKRQ